MKSFLGLTVSMFLSMVVFGQFVELYHIKGKFDALEFDNLYNVYAISGPEIVKYNTEGKRTFEFSDRQMGDVESLDVTYPLRPLVCYLELNYVILLDNTLSNNRGRINLTNSSIGLPTIGCSSVQNHFWFYDAMNFSLIRLNENFNVVVTTGNLSQVLRTELDPNFAVEFANRVYLNDPETGILVFDIFGTYIKTIPIKGLREFQVTGEEIVYFKDNNLHFYRARDYSETKLELPVRCSEAFVFENRIAALGEGGITVWEVVKP